MCRQQYWGVVKQCVHDRMPDEDVASTGKQMLQNAVYEIQKTAKTEADPCIICLESVSEKAIACPCQHQSFDFLCLASWLQEQPLCPLCTFLRRETTWHSYAADFLLGKSDVEYVEYGWPRRKRPLKYFIEKPRPHPQSPVTQQSTSLRQVPEEEDPAVHGPRPYRDSAVARPRREAPSSSSTLRRRNVYRSNLYSFHVGTNRLSGFQDMTPARFCEDGRLRSRAKAFIRRELCALHLLDARTYRRPLWRVSNAEVFLERVICMLKAVDLQASDGLAEQWLCQHFERKHARLFLHELRAWLRSPYLTLEAWDRHAQYRFDPDTSDDDERDEAIKIYERLLY